MRIIDLSMSILPGHVRWGTEVTAKGDLTAGDLAQVTTLKVSCHAYTHVDARRHMFIEGPTIEATKLDDLVGRCAVIDLLDAKPNDGFGPEQLAPRAKHLKKGGMALFKTGWDRHRSPQSKEFWLDSPFVTREGAQWLYDTGIKTIAFDFPQDYCIRLSLKGETRPIEEHVTHDILLRNGVHMIEYVANTAQIRESEVFLSAAPLKIPGSDGAPSRVYCIEGI
jgi:arylformamidase